ncbi:hypothetical protein SAMN05444682_101742 [Parapedobacter indicus]|uniref:Uncharacterized protein n=1 Tax=Parapedobacter indicus TaxID=1477437 RepID=A0A1I3E3N6_9SPHI|nr:hypothetical protein CLV26_101756 [Parapedobacter indicus]SFH93311.1 hypothetical protein SAMN05444682_101742 [Parapedobacter indicus]
MKKVGGRETFSRPALKSWPKTYKNRPIKYQTVLANIVKLLIVRMIRINLFILTPY